jgi:hypothetical protein
MLVQGAVALLNSTANVSAIANGNIMPIPAPADLSDYPCITYQTASDVSTYAITDPVATGITKSRIVFTCIAADYANARTLAQAVKQTLSGYRGTLSDGTQVLMTEIVNMADGFDDGSRLSTTAVHAMFTYLD